MARTAFVAAILGALGAAMITGADVQAPKASTIPSANRDHSPRRGLTLVFRDEFTPSLLDRRKWSPYESPGHGGNGLRRPAAFSVNRRGHLVVTARTIGENIVSGGMSLRRSYLYGYYEFRVRTEPDPSGTMNGVVLTWPRTGRWPMDGEIDIYETGAEASPRRRFSSFVHFGESNEQYYYRHAATAATWHSVGLDWTRSAIKVYRDGVLAWTMTDKSAIPSVPHRLCIQLDAMADRVLTRQVRMYVDYVRIWRGERHASRRRS